MKVGSYMSTPPLRHRGSRRSSSASPRVWQLAAYVRDVCTTTAVPPITHGDDPNNAMTPHTSGTFRVSAQPLRCRHPRDPRDSLRVCPSVRNPDRPTAAAAAVRCYVPTLIGIYHPGSSALTPDGSDGSRHEYIVSDDCGPTARLAI